MKRWGVTILLHIEKEKEYYTLCILCCVCEILYNIYIYENGWQLATLVYTPFNIDFSPQKGLGRHSFPFFTYVD